MWRFILCMWRSVYSEAVSADFWISLCSSFLSSVAGLAYREMGQQDFSSRKQRLFVPALAQRINIQRLSPVCSRALSYIPSVIFPFTFWSLCPPYNIHSANSGWMVYVTKLHMDTDYVLLPQSFACAHRCWLCHVAFPLFREGPYHKSGVNYAFHDF